MGDVRAVGGRDAGHGPCAQSRARFHGGVRASDLRRLPGNHAMSVALNDLLASVPYAWAELLLAGYALIAVLVGAWGGSRVFGFLCWLGAAVITAAGVLAITTAPA